MDSEERSVIGMRIAAKGLLARDHVGLDVIAALFFWRDQLVCSAIEEKG